MANNYYEILEINENATIEEIKKAYKKLVLKWHPDKNQDSEEANEKFMKINEAYNVLMGNIDDKYPNIPSRHNYTNIPRYFNPRIYIPKTRAPNREEVIFCSLEELYFGKIKKIQIDKIVRNKIIKKIIDIDIKPGLKSGTKIILNGENNMPGKIPGDIIFTIKEISHNIFRRINNNLIFILDISFEEAIDGFIKEIMLINGKILPISMKPLDHSKEILILPNGGMPIRENEKIIGYGDLIIEFKVNFKKV